MERLNMTSNEGVKNILIGKKLLWAASISLYPFDQRKWEKWKDQLHQFTMNNNPGLNWLVSVTSPAWKYWWYLIPWKERQVILFLLNSYVKRKNCVDKLRLLWKSKRDRSRIGKIILIQLNVLMRRSVATFNSLIERTKLLVYQLPCKKRHVPMTRVEQESWEQHS